MKKILILIIVVLASALFFQDELKQIISKPEVTVKYKDLIERDGLKYQKFTEVPFTGKVTGEQKGSLKNGKKDGDWVYYHKNGQLMKKGNYKNGKKEDAWVRYHDNGQLSLKGNYANDKQEGDFIGYHDNGKLSRKGNYKNGLREGNFLDYKEDGTVWKMFTGTFKNGEKISD
jgi:antitoxin component YwqK of YwqJK toxin-antitoxin module